MKALVVLLLLALASASSHHSDAIWLSNQNFRSPTGYHHCGENEYFSNSQCNHCDPFCVYTTPCPASCQPPKCMCKPGFYRDPLDRCVGPLDCPAIEPPWYGPPQHPSKVRTIDVMKCGRNEFFAEGDCLPCDHFCEPTACAEYCHSSYCMCKEGFVRDSHHRCIAREICPQIEF